MGPIIHIIICILTITIDHVQETIVRHIRVLLVQVIITLTVTIAIIIMMAIVAQDATVILQAVAHPVLMEIPVQVVIALTVTIAIIATMAIAVPDAIVIAQTAVHPVQTETAETVEQLQLRINHQQQLLQE
jgi:hypothetical protein